MKRAFTLIELLAVITILGIVALITYPIIDKSIQKSKEKALEQTINNIERAAYSYSVEYDLGYSTEQKALQLYELSSTGFITNKEHINPVTGEELQGCVLYRWDENKTQYEFKYSEPCEIQGEKPSITLTYDEKQINENGWLNENLMISINGTGRKYYYCISDSECEPNIEENKPNGTQIIIAEGTNVLCAKAANNSGESETVCTEQLKLDKTPPTAGTATFIGTLGLNDWYISDVSIILRDGSDSLSGHRSTTSSVNSITQNTLGTMIYIVTTDLAGNSSTEAINIKVDKNSPTINAKEGTISIVLGYNNPIKNYFNESYSISGGSVNCSPTNTNELEVGNNVVSCTVTGGNGKTMTAEKEIIVEPNNSQPVNFDYTGKEQTYVVPYSGYYKLETWGAQGGSTGSYSGGYGGYSSGEVYLEKNTVLYINVGGQGASTNGSSVTSVTGGYNGGGNAFSSRWDKGYFMCGAGGGATHIATISGKLSTLSNNKTDILIVSGGGGGANYDSGTMSRSGSGGAAGGYVAKNVTNQRVSVGGSQTLGGSNAGFGYGGSASGGIYCGGGAGYYGGGIPAGNNSPCAGGSSYIGNSLLTNKSMYCYNCTTSTEASTLTYSTTNVSSSPISQYAKIGNGYATITYISQ